MASPSLWAHVSHHGTCALTISVEIRYVALGAIQATRGQLEERISAEGRRFALFVPPGVYHGYRTLGAEPATIVNFPDRTYDAGGPDEERVAFDDPLIGYDWIERPGI